MNNRGVISSAPSPFNLPNTITIVRIVFAPVFVALLLIDGGADAALRWIAGILFIVGIATDGVDGHIARSRGLVTDLGKLLDPIADKILTGAALIGLSILAELPWWVTFIVLIREVGITVHRMVVRHEGVVAAAWMGKLKTVFQGIAISFALVPLWTVLGDWIFWVNGALMGIAVILTLASGVDYIITAIRSRRS